MTEPRSSSLAAELASRLPPLRILLAEDSVVNQKLALALLEPYGHRVDVAKDGAEAVRKWSAGEYDAVLMDVQMPELDGLEATRIIRAMERSTGRHAPIVALTAHAIKGDRELCLEAGMDAYISKPVRARELYGALEELYTRRPAEPAVSTSQSTAAAPASTAGTRSETAPQVAAGGNNLAGIVDWASAAAQFDSGETLLRELAALFLEECPKLLQDIREALSTTDSDKLRRAAHTLKGSAAVFRAQPMADISRQLELLAAGGDFEAAGATSASVESEAHRLVAALHRKLGKEARG